MDNLHEAVMGNAGVWLLVGGLVIGIAFGAVVQATNFCTMGSLSDMITFGDDRRFRAWVLAAGLSLVAVQLLAREGIVPVGKSMYLAPTLNWAGNVLGGLMFGVGMVLAGGCASRNLVRVGAGDLRSAVNLLVVGVFAYVAIGGLLGPVRAAMEEATSIGLGGFGMTTQGLGDVLAAVHVLPPGSANVWAAVIVGVPVFAWAFSSRAFATSPVHIFSAVGITACVVAGWVLTGLAFDELAAAPLAPISLTYVRPTGDAIEWLQRYTALGAPGFGVASVFGAVAGGFMVAIATGRFRISGFADKADMMRNLFGAVLMGIGGVMALGCTVGQGVTGVSTLAVGSFLTFIAIVTGGILGLKLMERLAA